MNTSGCFSPVERARVREAFSFAERLTGEFFDLVPGPRPAHRYDVKTLVQLKDHELNESAFAHLCKYSSDKGSERDPQRRFHFYRICLQDNRILDAVHRGSSFIKFVPLMLYIATHELVHILRFERGESDFDMPAGERTREERRVDAITRSILSPMADHGLKLVLDCFGSSYRIGDASN